MPKERIVPGISPFEVQVGWHADGDVQLGVEQMEGRSLLWALYGDRENLSRVGGELHSWFQMWMRQSDETSLQTDDEKQAYAIDLATTLLNMIESGPVDTDVLRNKNGYTGLWATLDRNDCNKVIRVLRTARSSAFGKDE